jgi:class 3 adenylate cyclase
VVEITVACILGAAIVAIRALGAAGRRWSMARHPSPTFVFADLVGYTALTERHGDEVAARVARQFFRTVSALSRQHRARHLKSMGDGAMIWVPDAADAVALASRVLTEVASSRDLLPVRIGAHTGPALMRDGDWFGRVVNVAARLADEAGPNEALISSATRSAAHSGVDVLLRTCAELELPGVEDPIAVWRLTHHEARAAWTGDTVDVEVVSAAGRIASLSTS